MSDEGLWEEEFTTYIMYCWAPMCRMQARGLQSCFVFSLLLFVQGEANVKIHPLICHKKEVEMERNDAYDYPFKT